MSLSSRRTRRAFTAFEVLLVTVALAATSTGYVAFLREAPRQTAQASGEASELRRVAERYLAQTGQCPTMAGLRRRRDVPFASIPGGGLDPWGKEYWFACRDGAVTVLSDGVDRKPFTSDDVADPLLRPQLVRRGSS